MTAQNRVESKMRQAAIRRSALRAALVASALCCTVAPLGVWANGGCNSPPQSTGATFTGHLDFELFAGQDYQGRVGSVAFDKHGNIWMATTSTLYHVQGNTPKVIEARPGERIALAPGGGVYARLLRKPPYGQFGVELLSPPKTSVANLLHPKDPLAFDGVFLGEEGRLVVTTTPLDDREGTGGRVEYRFWSASGTPYHDLILPARGIGVVAPTGTALLLLGKSRAHVFDSKGKELGRYDGAFRKGAIATDGIAALLNPASKKAFDKVHVVVSGRTKVLNMGSPVHHLALAAEGVHGAIALDKGVLVVVDTKTAGATWVKLPGDVLSYITDIRFIDSSTLAVGMIRVSRTEPESSGRLNFTTGAIVAVDLKGNVLFNCEFPLKKPAAYMPLIESTYGSKRFAARAADRVTFVTLQ